MDVKSAFFHTELKEEIYMKQPEGYIEDSSLVYKLRKSLYGLKQAQRAQYSKMDAFLMSHKFERCRSNYNVYMQKKEGSFLLIMLYVDDLFITSNSVTGLRSIKYALNKAFAMTNLGMLRQFIGLKVSQNTLGIMLSQSRYSLDMLRIFHMEDYNATPFPFLSHIRLEEGGSAPLVDNTLFIQLIGGLVYLTHSRKYISYAMSVDARYI